jgi:NAD(P)H-quinone oxidoreductase subunit 5
MYRMIGQKEGGNQAASDNGGAALLALLAMMAAGSVVLLAWQALTSQPARFAGITIDRLSASLTLLVAAVGVVTFRFSQRYLVGEAGRQRFLRQLAFVMAAAYVLMLSSNLLLLFAAWSLTSLGLHMLLTHYQDRAEARRPARKKFLISRLGDLALIAAIALVWRHWDTLDLYIFLERVAVSPKNAAATPVGILVVLAALTKSAQFPFHSWLPETMEAPTPVSALMHAGIINAGGALLLRFAPLIVRVPEALFALAFIGTLTIAVGTLAMWAQVKVKHTLAWSTVSQMGFMMVQCGLAAFPAALLHILGHGCYKAWSFLKSGEVPPPMPCIRFVPPSRRLTLAALGTSLSVPGMVLASWVTGFSPWHSPGELALSVIVAMSLGQFWVAWLGPSAEGCARTMLRIAGTLLSTFVLVTVVFTLYRGASVFLEPVLGDLPVPSGPMAWSAAILPILVLVLLTLIQAFLPVLGHTSLGRALYTHALHGFYFGAVADRVVDGIWKRFFTPTKEVARA